MKFTALDGSRSPGWIGGADYYFSGMSDAGDASFGTTVHSSVRHPNTLNRSFLQRNARRLVLIVKNENALRRPGKYPTVGFFVRQVILL